MLTTNQNQPKLSSNIVDYPSFRNHLVILRPEIQTKPWHRRKLFWGILASVILFTALTFAGPSFLKPTPPVPSWRSSIFPKELVLHQLTGNPEIFISEQSAWVYLKDHLMDLNKSSRLRTDSRNSLDLQYEDFLIRLKPNSELEALAFSDETKHGIYFSLIKGMLLARKNPEDAKSESFIPMLQNNFLVTFTSGSWTAQVHAQTHQTIMACSRGEGTLQAEGEETIPFSGKAILSSDSAPRISEITSNDWERLKETYTLESQKTWLNLRSSSKNPSDFFRYVSRMGVLHFKSDGYLNFDLDPAGETFTSNSSIKIFFDVLGQNAQTGLYFKMAPFTLNHYEAIEIKFDSSDLKPQPQNWSLEFESEGEIIKRFHLQDHLTQNGVRIPLKGHEDLSIDRVRLVIKHPKKNSDSSGALWIKSIRFVDKPIPSPPKVTASKIVLMKSQKNPIIPVPKQETSTSDLDQLVSELHNLTQRIRQNEPTPTSR